MFLHAADRGQKEAEWMVHWGHCGSVYDHSSEANQSAMELVRYHTSQREMRDIYQSIYLLWRVPGSPPCGAQPRRRAIQDILSSLKSQLHRCGCSSTGRNLESQDRQVESNWHDSYEEGLRAACQRALDTTEALESDLERLHWQRRDRSWSCSQSRSHSRTRDCSRNCSWSERPEASLGATVELGANTISKVTWEMCTLCPLKDPCWGEESPSGTLKWIQVLRETLRATQWSPLSLTLRDAWNCRPTSWAHPHGGWNSKLFHA